MSDDKLKKATADLIVRCWLADNLNDVWGHIHQFVETTGLLTKEEIDYYESIADHDDPEWHETIGLVCGMQEKYNGRLKYSNGGVIDLKEEV